MTFIALETNKKNNSTTKLCSAVNRVHGRKQERWRGRDRERGRDRKKERKKLWERRRELWAAEICLKWNGSVRYGARRNISQAVWAEMRTRQSAASEAEAEETEAGKRSRQVRSREDGWARRRATSERERDFHFLCVLINVILILVMGWECWTPVYISLIKSFIVRLALLILYRLFTFNVAPSRHKVTLIAAPHIKRTVGDGYCFSP